MSSSPSSSRVLLFSVAGIPLGVPLEDLLRVLPTEEILPLPLAHPALVGVMETLEGLCPVYDLAVLGVMQAPAPGPGEPMVALFGLPGGGVALRLDRLRGMATEVRAVPPDEERAMLEALPPAWRPLVQGVARAGEQRFGFFSKDAFLALVSGTQAGAHPGP